MLFSQLIQELSPNPSILNDHEDQDILGIAYDSRKVEPGFLFVAIPGTAVDGHDFIDQAIERGAVAVV